MQPQATTSELRSVADWLRDSRANPHQHQATGAVRTAARRGLRNLRLLVRAQ